MENNNPQTFENTIVEKKWNSCPPFLHIHLPEKSTKLSKKAIRKDIINSLKINLFWLFMSISFGITPIIVIILKLTVKKDIEWYWWVIFVGIYGILGIVFTIAFIKSEINRSKLKKAVPNDLCFKIIICNEKKFDNSYDYNDYQIITNYGNYSIYNDAYKILKPGDELAFIQIKDYFIAYPLKLWTLEGVND